MLVALGRREGDTYSRFSSVSFMIRGPVRMMIQTFTGDLPLFPPDSGMERSRIRELTLIPSVVRRYIRMIIYGFSILLQGRHGV